LLSGIGNRSYTVGGILASAVTGANVVVNTAISGMQLNNSVGVNDFIEVETYLNATGYIFHNVTVENNNLLTFICLTTVIYDPTVNEYYQMSIIERQTMTLTPTSTGLADIPYSERFDG
jgi:hypothetical protein